MAGKKSKKSNNNPKNIQPNIPTIPIQQIDKIKEEKGSTTNSQQNRNTKTDCPQPLLVKIEKSKGLTNAEKISIFSIVLSVALFFMNLASFNKTSDAVKISEKALSNTIIKDSVLNQPYLQVSSVALGIVDTITILKYVLKNFGQLPGIVLKQAVNVTYKYKSDADKIRENPLFIFPPNEIFSENPIIISKENIDTMGIQIPAIDGSQIPLLANGITFCYFYGTIQYTSSLYATPHEYKFVIQLGFERAPGAKIWRNKFLFLYNNTTVTQ